MYMLRSRAASSTVAKCSQRPPSRSMFPDIDHNPVCCATQSILKVCRRHPTIRQAYLDTEVECIRRLRNRLSTGDAKLSAILREVEEYEALELPKVVSTTHKASWRVCVAVGMLAVLPTNSLTSPGPWFSVSCSHVGSK